MFASGSADHLINRIAQPFAVRHLLQQGLAVFRRRNILVNQFFPVLVNKSNRLLTTGIHKNSADNRLANITQHIFIFANFFVRHHHKLVKMERQSHFRHRLLADQTGMPLRQTALRLIRKHPV
ncbi:unknown [Azospirillum sp. CAG:260]|nr:unknown [Azospirillum sp. CAG:260]